MKHNSVSRMVLAAVLVVASHVFGATKTVTWTLPADWETNVEYGENNGRFAVVGSDFGYPTEPIGAPALPFLPVSIAMPNGAIYSNCTIEAVWTTVDTKLRPSVIQEPHVVGADPIETPEDPQYFGAACYPSTPNDLMTVMTLDGVPTLTARITPYRWNGKKGVLEKAVSLKVAFTCVAPRATLKLATAAASDKVDFVIISPSAYVTWWEEYAAYRRSTHTNLTFLVKNADEIYADFEGHDDALKIHHYLEHMYANCATKYVLLGAGCPKGTEAYDSTSMIQLRMTASCNQLYYPSDMYYACMERKNNAGEVWDPNGDGVYLGAKKSGGGYSSDGYYTIDWTPELSVFRFPARKVATLNNTSYTAQQQIQGFIEKLKRVEAADFAGNLRTGLTGYKVFAQKGHGDTSDYMAQERTFYDGMDNIFNSSHQNPTFDWEYDTRSVHYNYMLAYRPESAGVYHATTTPEAATFGNQNMEAFLHSSHGAPGGAVPLANLNFWTTKAIQKISFMCESCLTGKIDEADKITLPEAQLLNPNGGAVVSFNNTREGWGWANGFDSLSSKMKLSILMGFFSAKEDTSNTAAEAFAYGQRRYLPTIGGGSGNVGAACYLEVIAFGDPLVTLSKVTDCADLPATVSSAFYRYATTTNKTLHADARSAVTKLTVNGLGNETFVVSGQDFRAFKGMAINGGGNLKWDAPGGIGGAGLAFEKPGDLEISATGTTYFGPIFSNVSNVLVSGQNATLDFDKTGKTRTLASLAFTGAGPNYIRSREGGIFPADFTIPVTSGTLVLQTQNIGGGGAAEHPDVPMFALTNATLQIAENPNWGTEFLNRAVWMTSSTIYSGYQSFGFGSSNASANGIDIHVLDGVNNISGWADAEVNGELRAHVSEGASLNVNIALVKSSKSGSIRKLGAGTMTMNGSLGKNATIAGGITVAEGRLVAAGTTAEAALGVGAVTVEEGGELELTTIPLTTITKLTVKKGGKLYLPGTAGTAAYQVVDPLRSSLTIEEGAFVYNVHDQETAIPGTATGDGYYMDASGFINWHDADGEWKDDVSLKNWETVSGMATGYVNGASVQFKDHETDMINVGVSGNLVPSYLNFVNTKTAYNFTNATAGAFITLGTFNTTGNVIIEPELNVSGKTIIGSGKATVSKIGTASAAILGGGALRVTNALNPQTMISQVRLNVTKTYENYTTIYIPGTSLIVSQGIDCRGWSIHEFQLYDANGDLMALPEGTVVSGSSSNCGGSSEGYRSGSFTVTSSSAGKVNSYSGSPNGLQYVFDGNTTGNYWGYAKSDSKQSTDGFKPQFSITITFPSPVSMISGYRIGSADNAKRQIEAWNVQVTEAISEGTYTVSTGTMSGGAINSWWPSTGKYAATYSGTTGAGSIAVADGAKLYLDGTMNVKPTLADGAILAVTNSECMTVNKGFTMGNSISVDVSEADKVGWTKVLAGASLAFGDVGKFVMSTDDSAVKIANGDLYIATKGVLKGPYKRTITDATWNWDADTWKANGADFGATWSSAITRMADDVYIAINNSSTGTLACAVSASTVYFTNETESAQSVAILGNGALNCTTLDFTGLRGTIEFEPSINGANVNVGTNAVILKGGNGGILNVASNGYLSTVGTFSTYNIANETRLHFANKDRSLNMSQIPSCGVLSFEGMTLSGDAGTFQRPNITYLVRDGESLSLTESATYNARCTSSFDIRGGDLTINPSGAWWFGENGITTYKQSGGTVTCQATGTTAQSSASGVILGYQGEGSYLLDMDITGGKFLAENAIINFWNPGKITLGSNALLRAKGVAARSEITASLNIEAGGTFEIGSLGFTATPVNYNIYGGTLAAYEDLTLTTPFNLAGYGTLAAKAGTTLTVNGAINADDATLNIGVAAGIGVEGYAGTVKLETIPEGVTNITVSAGTWDMGLLRPTNAILSKLDGTLAARLTDDELRTAAQGGLKLFRTTMAKDTDLAGKILVRTTTGTEVPASGTITNDGYLKLGVTYVYPLYGEVKVKDEGEQYAFSDIEWSDAIGMPFHGEWGEVTSIVLSNALEDVTVAVTNDFAKSITVVNQGKVKVEGEQWIATFDDCASTGKTTLDIIANNVTAGATTVIKKSVTGTTVIGSGKMVVFADGVEPGTYTISAGGTIRYEGARDQTCYDATAGVYNNYENAFISVPQKSGRDNDAWFKCTDGDYMRVMGEYTDAINALGWNVLVTGGEFHFATNYDGQATWYGRNGRTFTQTGGKTVVETRDASYGFFVNYAGGDGKTTFNISGGLFDCAETRFKFGKANAADVNVSGGEMRVLGVLKHNTDAAVGGTINLAGGRFSIGASGIAANIATLNLSGGEFHAFDTTALNGAFSVTAQTRMTAAHGATLSVGVVPTGSAPLICGDATDDGTVLFKGGDYSNVTLGGMFTIQLTAAQEAAVENVNLFKLAEGFDAEKVTVKSSAGEAASGNSVLRNGYVTWVPSTAAQLPIVGEVSGAAAISTIAWHDSSNPSRIIAAGELTKYDDIILCATGDATVTNDYTATYEKITVTGDGAVRFVKSATATFTKCILEADVVSESDAVKFTSVDVPEGRTLSVCKPSNVSAVTGNGTVKIVGTITDCKGDDWSCLGNANSKLVLDGNVTGYLKPAMTVASAFELNGTLAINNGNSKNGGNVFSGALTGDGKISTTGAQSDVIAFTGDTSGFAGTVSVAGSHCVAFGEQADDDTCCGKIVISSTAPIVAGKKWSAVNGIVVKSGGFLNIVSDDPSVATFVVSDNALTVDGGIMLNGAVLRKDAYTVSGGTITLNGSAANGDSVSINVIGGAKDTASKTITTGLAGVLPVVAANWNQGAQKTTTDAVNVTLPNLKEVLADGTTLNGPMTATLLAKNAYSAAGKSTTSTGDGELMFGYLDDGDRGSGAAATISVTGIPYTSYDVYVYMGSDATTTSGSFAPVSVTAGGTTVKYPKTNTGWGSACATHGAVTLTEKSNYLRFTGLTGSSLMVSGSKNGTVSNARCGIAGIQIFNTGTRVNEMVWKDAASGGTWDKVSLRWSSSASASVCWKEELGTLNVATFTNDTSLTLGEVVMPDVINIASNRTTHANADFVQKTETVMFENVWLADVSSIGGEMWGSWITSDGPATPCFTTRTADSIETQMQLKDGELKCVKIRLTQDGANVRAQALWAAYQSGAALGSVDFENKSHNGTVVTSADAAGYGIRNLALHIDRQGVLTVRDAQNFGKPFVVSNGILRVRANELKHDVTLVAGAQIDVISEPTIADGGGEISVNPTNAAEYVVSAENVKPQITIEGAGDHTIVVPPAVTNVVGVAPEKIKVRHGGHDITSAFTKSGNAAGVVLSLNPDGKVVINGEEIAVTPEFSTMDGDELMADAPFVVGEDVAVGVKSIPGLTYRLMRGAEIGAYGHEAAAETATGSRVKLQDTQKPEGKAFYIITVD